MTDTLVSPGSDVGTGDVSSPSSGGSNGGAFAGWSPGKKIAILGGGGMLTLIAIYLYAKKKSASSVGSGTTANTNSTTPTLVLPSSNQDALGSTDFSGLSQGLGNLSNQVSQLNATSTPTPTPTPQPDNDPTQAPPTPVPTPSPAPSPAPPPAPPFDPSQNPVQSPPPTTTLGGNEYYVLGGAANMNDYHGDNVKNGAPVYFTWNGQGIPEQGLLPPELASGIVAYTPVSTPLSEIGWVQQGGRI